MYKMLNLRRDMDNGIWPKGYSLHEVWVLLLNAVQIVPTPPARILGGWPSGPVD